MNSYYESILEDLAARVSGVEQAALAADEQQERRRLGVCALVQSREAQRWGEPELATRALAVAAFCLRGFSEKERP
jgi:hypothetical protein